MSTANYSNYSAEDFLDDASFQEWVHNPSSENKRYWEDFLEQYPHQKVPLRQAQQMLAHMQAYFNSDDQPRKLADEELRKSLLQTMEESKALKKAKKVRSMRWLAVAASVILLLGTVSWFFLQSPQMVVETTAYAEWKTISLPDGSAVRLNANSKLTYSENWEAGVDRKVWLEGEAYFEVEKKPSTGAKFKVVTQDMTIEVLGTRFNVRNRKEQTNVFLVEGKIKLELGKEETFLEPGDYLAYSIKKKAITERYKAPQEFHTSWKDGTCMLKETPVAEILTRIEEIYGVTFKIENQAITNQIKTVAIPLDKLEITLPILEQVLGVDIIQVNDQLIIK